MIIFLHELKPQPDQYHVFAFSKSACRTGNFSAFLKIMNYCDRILMHSSHMYFCHMYYHSLYRAPPPRAGQRLL